MARWTRHLNARGYVFATPNTASASTPSTSPPNDRMSRAADRSPQSSRRPKKAASRAPYAKLRKLVASGETKPPQQWYDQTDDPFAPKAKTR
jgi:hypothetical protein